MIVEVTALKIKENQNQAFEDAIQKAAKEFIAPFQGCLGYSIRREVENPLNYVIEIRWKTLADHMDHFRKSDVFTAWRAAISPYFTQPPETYHCEVIAVDEI